MDAIIEKQIKPNRLIYLLSTLGFFGIFSTTMAKSPVLPLYVNSLGADNTVVGLISAFSPFAGIVFSFPVGLMIDNWGKKKLLLISALVFVLAPLLYLLVSNAWLLIPIRFFHGIATAILGPLSATMIFNEYPKTKGEKLGLYSSATLVGRTLAPLVGGAIISYFSYLNGLWNYRLVYIAVFLLSLPVLILALFYKEPNNQGSPFVSKRLKFLDVWQALKRIVGESRLFSTAVTEMSIYFNYGVLETFLPLYLKNYGYGGKEIGLVFSVQILIIALTKPMFGKMADRTDKRIQIIAGMLVLALAILLLPFVTNYWLIILISILFGLGMSISTIATNSFVPEIIKPEDLGASMGALSSLMDVGQSFGPFMAGAIITYSSYTYGFLSAAIIAVLSTLIFVWFNFRKV